MEEAVAAQGVTELFDENNISCTLTFRGQYSCREREKYVCQ